VIYLIGSSMQRWYLLVFMLVVFHIYWWYGTNYFKNVILGFGGRGGGVMVVDEEEICKGEAGREGEGVVDGDVSKSICGVV